MRARLRRLLDGISRWFTRSWWKYLLKDCTGPRNFICRARGHPTGVWWFNAGRNDPDMHCKNCDEDLG
jgi:hypothetical protein